jgi:hypothetical protein
MHIQEAKERHIRYQRSAMTAATRMIQAASACGRSAKGLTPQLDAFRTKQQLLLWLSSK